MKSNSSNKWRWFFILAALEAGAASVVLARTPHGNEGYSASRLGLLVLLGALFAFAGYLAARLPGNLDNLARPHYALAAFLLAFVLTVVLFLLRYLNPERLLPYYQRLSPLLTYLLLLVAQFSLWCMAVRYGAHPAAAEDERPMWRAGLLAFALLLLGFVFVAASRIGLTPDSAYWGEPGVPILGWQFALALFAGGCLLIAGIRLRGLPRMDLVLATCIWLLAAGIWLSVPTSVMKNSFYGPIDPPANQPFPNSDAGYYDSMAESLLIGYPYQGVIPTRPLYIVLLALLHAVAGERYDLIIAAQTLVLALIPVVLYFLGRRLHSSRAGVIVALFAVFREWNSLLISSQTRVSNTRTLLVDLPTLLLMLVACLLVVRSAQLRDRKSALLAGGVFGLLLLLRTQTALLFPIICVLIILAYGIRSPAWRLPLGLVVLGVLASSVPWLLHNYLYSGQVTLDAPFQYQIIASQYKYTGNLDINAIDLEGKSLLGILLTFAIRDPKFVAGFIATHFFATLINSMLALPLFETYNGLRAPLNLYWMNGPVGLSGANIALLVAYLAVISIGLAAAWKRLRWAGLMPLAFALGYALANGIGRFSGWRYDLPADWVAYFYLGIGAAEILGAFALLFGAARDRVVTTSMAEPAVQSNWMMLGLICAAFAVIGAVPWIAEGLASPRYADEKLPVLVSRLSASTAVEQLRIDQSAIEKFAADPQAAIEIGRILYPRFFSRGTGLASAHPWPAYAVRDFPRVGFLILNQSRQDALVALRQSPAIFPQAADAIILGCQQTGYLDVRLILFPDSETAYLSAPLDEPCK